MKVCRGDIMICEIEQAVCFDGMYLSKEGCLSAHAKDCRQTNESEYFLHPSRLILLFLLELFCFRYYPPAAGATFPLEDAGDARFFNQVGNCNPAASAMPT